MRFFASIFFHQTDPSGILINGLKSFCWKFFFFVKPFKFDVFYHCGKQRKRFFSVVGYNRSFFPLWDTTEKVFLCCGIQQKRIFSVVGYNGEQSQGGKQIFFHVFHNAGNFSSVVSYTTTEYFAVYCILEKSSALYPTTTQVFFHCIPQWKIFHYNARGFFRYEIQRKKFSSIVGYNRRGFFLLWDTTEEVFFHCGIQWEKNIQLRMIFLNFKCLSLPSNKNVGKISYLNSQTKPWKELIMENYMVNHEKKIFSLWDTAQQRFFKFLNLNNFTKINFSAKLCPTRL